jgi:thiamine-phosphate pyrophosphorylase
MSNASAQEPPRLVLVSPVLAPDGDLLPAMSDALGAAQFAAVILRVEPGGDERALLKVLKPLVEAAQAAGAAVLIEGAPDLVGKSGADGVHALGENQAREAAERFRPEKMVGVGGLRTRDIAMTVGELGADYVLFGDPGKGGEVPPLDALVERLDWWSEIFVVPCVGYAADLSAVPAIAASGAEFLAFGPFVWSHADGPAAAIGEAVAQLGVEAAA